MFPTTSEFPTESPALRGCRLLRRILKRFPGGLVFRAHRLSVSLTSSPVSNKEEVGWYRAAPVANRRLVLPPLHSQRLFDIGVRRGCLLLACFVVEGLGSTVPTDYHGFDDCVVD